MKMDVSKWSCVLCFVDGFLSSVLQGISRNLQYCINCFYFPSAESWVLHLELNIVLVVTFSATQLWCFDRKSPCQNCTFCVEPHTKKQRECCCRHQCESSTVQAHLAKQLSRGVHPPTAITQPPSLLSTLPPSPFCPSPFLMRVREYHPGKIVELKMLVGEF